MITCVYIFINIFRNGERVLSLLILKCGLHFGESMNLGIWEIWLWARRFTPLSLTGHIFNMWYNICFTRLFGGFHEIICKSTWLRVYILYLYWFLSSCTLLFASELSLNFFVVEGRMRACVSETFSLWMLV